MSGFDVLIVGGGIVGMAHAIAASNAGLRACVVERTARPVGASVRNFGMVWPIGQVAGLGLDLATRSRTIWLDLAREVGFDARESGSVHAVYEDDEFEVLRAFARREAGRPGRHVEVLGPEALLERVPQINPRGLRGGLWSGTELAVDPREAVGKTFAWLARRDGVEIVRGVAIAARPGAVSLSDGRVLEADRVLVCSGPDTRTLYPDVYAASGLTLCKLQMMRTAPQPAGWRLHPHLAGGLTLCHYASFEGCPGRDALAARFRDQMPAYVANGVHVMASQNALGELVIGDSHHYGDDAEDPFNLAAVNDLVLAYLRRMLVAPDLSVAETWHGVYPKFPGGRLVLIEHPEPGVTIVNGVGGAGMTLSLAVGERVIAFGGVEAPAREPAAAS